MGYKLKPAAQTMRHALTLSLLLAIGLAGNAFGSDKPLRLAQSQISAAPSAGTVSQIQPDLNVSQTIQGNRVDIIQNAQPVQCRLNCTSQQQSCWATCR